MRDYFSLLLPFIAFLGSDCQRIWLLFQPRTGSVQKCLDPINSRYHVCYGVNHHGPGPKGIPQGTSGITHWCSASIPAYACSRLVHQPPV